MKHRVVLPYSNTAFRRPVKKLAVAGLVALGTSGLPAVWAASGSADPVSHSL